MLDLLALVKFLSEQIVQFNRPFLLFANSEGFDQLCSEVALHLIISQVVLRNLKSWHISKAVLHYID